MHSGEYMLPGELVAVVAFLFAPPLSLAFAAQTIAFVANRMFRSGAIGRAASCYALTAVGSLALAAAINFAAPNSWSPALRVRDIYLAGSYWPVMPLAFLAVTLAALPLTLWALRGNARHG